MARRLAHVARRVARDRRASTGVRPAADGIDDEGAHQRDERRGHQRRYQQ
jgi:hypothetical protein